MLRILVCEKFNDASAWKPELLAKSDIDLQGLTFHSSFEVCNGLFDIMIYSVYSAYFRLRRLVGI
jgi:hypothetical protein